MTETISMQDIMINQPVLSIGMIGHVSNGKSSIVRSLTGKVTGTHTAEQVRNITIKLGYANAKIFKCNICDPPECYKSVSSEVINLNCEFCEEPMQLTTHVSFVDVPGHNSLMTTMLNGTCVMDYTILVEALNNKELPAPQTMEHITATTVTKTPNKIICLNKLDLIGKEEVKIKTKELLDKLKNTIVANSYLIPVSATFNANMDVLCECISNLKIPERNLHKPFKMSIVRTFNINRPGIKIQDMKGGVIGGKLIEGILHVNDNVYIKPGYVFKNENKWHFHPLKAKILSLKSDNVSLDKIIPGGLIAVQLDIDPALTSDDKLIGNVLLCEKEKDNYQVFENITIVFTPCTTNSQDYKLVVGNEVNINSDACNSVCAITKINTDEVELHLKMKPLCTQLGEKITLSSIANHDSGIKILGDGHIIKGQFAIEC